MTDQLTKIDQPQEHSCQRIMYTVPHCLQAVEIRLEERFLDSATQSHNMYVETNAQEVKDYDFAKENTESFNTEWL